MDREKRRRIDCPGCSENLSHRQHLRHKTQGKCGLQPTVLLTPLEKQEFLRHVALNQLGNLGKEDAVFFDVPIDSGDLGIGEEIHFDIPEVSSAKSSHVNEESPPEPDRNTLVSYISKFQLKWQAEYNVPETALDHQLKFLNTVFNALSAESDLSKHLAQNIPTTCRHLRKEFAEVATCTRYVVCPKCKELYKEEDCFYSLEGKLFPKPCPAVSFSNSEHPKVCREPLLKISEERDKNGQHKLIAEKVYYYNDLESALKKLVNRPKFEELCEEWREKKKNDNVTILTGFQDGEVWKDFEGRKYDFLNKERNYGLILNVDWFQPFDKVQYSVGVIYLVVANLPPEHMYKKENVILVGVIPAFEQEPSTNTFLDPLVSDLVRAWNKGFLMTSYTSPLIPLQFKLCLLCCGCDIPASRKVCGFLGHMATKGCNKCLKQFPGRVGQKVYGGFDRENWEPRTEEAHRQDVQWILDNAQNKTELAQMESEFGVRYSVLLKLPYFDPIRMCIIDPMHNFFLGTAKHFMRVAKEEELISKAQFAEIQALIDKFRCPADIGRIPHKIASGFSGLTADQWKNWTLLFSMVALEDILDKQYLQCWQKFVKACRYLCTKVLDLDALDKADKLILDFCCDFEKLFGADRVTPNMHLHCHIKQIILDYGPIYGFWLFSFERYNGILGNYSTNNRNIEGQLFKKFTTEVKVDELLMNPGLSNDMRSVLQQLNHVNKQRGSLLSQSKDVNVIEVAALSTTQCVVQEKEWDLPADEMENLPTKSASLTSVEAGYLQSMYRYLYGDDDFKMCPSYLSSNSVDIMGQRLGAQEGRSKRSAAISANWCSNTGDINTTTTNLTIRPGVVENYFIHKTIRHNAEKWHVLAKVSWYAKLQRRRHEKHVDIAPAERWSDLYVDPGPACFIPVQRIKSRTVNLKRTVKGRNILYVCPRQRYLVFE